MMAAPLLEVSGLSAGYGALQILWDVVLGVHDSEYVAVLGSNGVGKSTLLKTIAGILPAMSGTIRWQGRDITHLGPASRVRLGISLVPEGKRLFAGMTVRENLVMGAFARRDRSGVATDLDWVLSLFPPLSGKLERVAGTLSGGEQQMCAIGRGLLARPRLLLVDELSFGLSPIITDALLETVANINREGMSVILVEQDVLAALRYARRGYVISEGRIVKEGPAANLAADPLIKKNYLGV